MVLCLPVGASNAYKHAISNSLFHISTQDSFHLSLTVLVHYRSYILFRLSKWAYSVRSNISRVSHYSFIWNGKYSSYWNFTIYVSVFQHFRKYFLYTNNSLFWVRSPLLPDSIFISIRISYLDISIRLYTKSIVWYWK